MKHALYIIGEPGSGKSTLVDTLAAGALPIAGRRPLAHVFYHTDGPGVTELGVRDPGRAFGGTDGLSMSAVVPAEAWVKAAWPHDSLLMAEGDRLACDRFFNALLFGCWSLRIVYLEVPPAVADERRAERTARLGGEPQNETWLKGRRSKVARLVDDWADYVYRLDGEKSPAELARELSLVSPVAADLYGEEAAT